MNVRFNKHFVVRDECCRVFIYRMENQESHFDPTKTFSPDNFRFLSNIMYKNQKVFGFYNNFDLQKFLNYDFSLKTIKIFKLV